MGLTGLWWWIDRWRKSTAYTDMTLEEQGAYRNLLDEASLRDGPLPNNDAVLAKACGDPRKWRRVRPAVMRHFVLAKDGCWHNATLDDVLRESHRRATNQARYRRRRGYGPAPSPDNKGDNGRDNEPDNGAGNDPITNPITEPITQPASTDNKRDNKPDSPDPDPDPDQNVQSVCTAPSAEIPGKPPPPLDRWFVELQADYPEHRVTHGFMTSSLFFAAFQHDARPAAVVWAEMRANLESQKASPEWAVRGMAPKLEKWLRDGLWKHRAFEAKPARGGKTGAAPAGKYDDVMEG